MLTVQNMLHDFATDTGKGNRASGEIIVRETGKAMEDVMSVTFSHLDVTKRAAWFRIVSNTSS